MRKEIIGDCELYLGDCLEILPQLPRIDCVVTSPPYDQQRDYGKKIVNWRGLVSDALVQINDDSQILCNLGLIYRNGSCVRYWDGLIEDMEESDWRLAGWYVWDQGSGLPGEWNGRFAPSHEWIFHFNKQPVKLNKIVVSKYAGLDCTKGSTGQRRKNGKVAGWTQMGKPVQDYKIGDSVIRAYRDTYRTGLENDHPATFPVKFPKLLIDSFSDIEQLVLDPFMGSGTTGVACVNLQRKFIGIEIEPKYFDIACKRIEAANKQMHLFPATNPPPAG